MSEFFARYRNGKECPYCNETEGISIDEDGFKYCPSCDSMWLTGEENFGTMRSGE